MVPVLLWKPPHLSTTHTHGATSPTCFTSHSQWELDFRTRKKRLEVSIPYLEIIGQLLSQEVSLTLGSNSYFILIARAVWPTIDASKIDTSGLAAVAAWHTIQAFFTNLEHLDPKVKSINFNLWTESYGGHYGPIFWDYFFGQNEAIKNKTQKGFQLNLDTIGVSKSCFSYDVLLNFVADWQWDH
jgi:hypothetical protein